MKNLILIATLTSSLIALFGSAPSVSAANVLVDCQKQYILAYPAWSNGLKCSYDNDSGATAEAKVPRPALESINHTWIIVLNIVQWIIITAGYAAVGYILYGGFRYITAQGEPAAIVEAKNSILHAIIGLVVALGSVMIVRTVQTAILTGSLI